VSVSCQDLHFAYRDRVALAGVSLTAKAGSIEGLLGPNGSGKSTLLQILATIRKPQRGTVTMFGHDAVSDPAAVRRLLGVVFQQRSLDSLLTVEENLTCAGALYGMKGAPLRTAVSQALDRFSLSERRSERVKTLSGGLARRVELAKALVHRPRLLILDEPSTGLDPRARREFWQAIRSQVVETGLTAIVSTHLGEEAEHCDSLALMADGKVVATGTPDALKGQIAEDTLRLKSGAIASLAADIRALRPALALEVVEDEVWIRDAAAERLLVELVQACGPKVSSATLQRPTLEDVFVKLTGSALVV
jgi:ABC-2 type transport system ATP-binding protein